MGRGLASGTSPQGPQLGRPNEFKMVPASPAFPGERLRLAWQLHAGSSRESLKQGHCDLEGLSAPQFRADEQTILEITSWVIIAKDTGILEFGLAICAAVF